MSLRFTVLGAPVGKARARVTRFGTYTPEKTVAMQNYVKLMASQVYSGPPWRGAVRVDFDIVYKRPYRLPKDRDWPSCKPDVDNVMKLVFDSLNRLVYTDDSNVTQGSWVKRYTVGDEEPHVDVTVTLLRGHARRK